MSGTPEQTDEELAAAWGAETEAEADPAADSVQPARVLNQAEIDSLLGFDDGPAGGEARTGMQKIISSGLVSYERLPMLEIVFDRLVRIMSTSLRNFTSDNVEVGIDNILSLRFGDYLNSIPLPAMLAVFKAEEWDNYGLMVIDSAMIYSIVDVLLGGRRGTAAMRIEGRPYTTIERTLVERLIQVVLADLSASFDPLCPVTFRFERLEVNPRFATISRLSNAAILARLRIDMEDRGGRLELLLPYATLEPVRELLLQQFMGEKFGRDSIWETHLAEELWNTEVELSVVLDEHIMRLSDVIDLKPGQQLLAQHRPRRGRFGALRLGGAVRGPHRPEEQQRRRQDRARTRPRRRLPRSFLGSLNHLLTIVGTMAGMEWTLEIVLVVLLAATLFQAVRLERALGVLKRDRAALEDLVLHFNASTRQAESGIERLRAAADGAGREIDDQITRIRLAEGRPRLPDRTRRPAGRPAGHAGAGGRPLVQDRTAATMPRTPAPPNGTSQAERNLLQALRMAR